MEYQYLEFEWNSILIALTYRHKRWGVIDHIELETIDPPRAPLPITETGYRSHFLDASELEFFENDPHQYVLAWLNEAGEQPAWQKQQDDARQYSLF